MPESATPRSPAIGADQDQAEVPAQPGTDRVHGIRRSGASTTRYPDRVDGTTSPSRGSVCDRKEER